ncbi:MAG TPA: hypothetical protein VJ399_01215 [Patescibacteria group bacterium]|nr:hypothetical protein [Patescibacteria group bacterium]
MRKEIFFAILAGSLFGLIIAFGIWKANSSMKSNGSTSETLPSEESSSPTPQPQIGLTLAKPEDADVVTESPITVSGATKPNAWVTISAESKDYVIKADMNGGFQQLVDLIGGANEIVITSFDESGNSNTQNLIVVLSSEFAK